MTWSTASQYLLSGTESSLSGHAHADGSRTRGDVSAVITAAGLSDTVWCQRRLMKAAVPPVSVDSGKILQVSVEKAHLSVCVLSTRLFLDHVNLRGEHNGPGILPSNQCGSFSLLCCIIQHGRGWERKSEAWSPPVLGREAKQER